MIQNPHSIQADTHDYFLRRPKAGRLHPSSKSGPDMIISCGDLRLVGSKSSKSGSEPPLYIITVWLVALRLGEVVFQRLHQNSHHIWCCARSGWWLCGSMGWRSKTLHQNPTQFTTRAPTLFWGTRWGWDEPQHVLSQNPAVKRAPTCFVPEPLFCILLACRYLWLFSLYININSGKNGCFMLD